MEANAAKECLGIVVRNRGALQNVRKTLDEAILLAARDFVNVHSLFRSCYESHDSGLRDELTSCGLAEDLQYIDILRQKIEHVVALQTGVEEEGEFMVLSGAIFKLNYFQIKVADFDFSIITGRIRSKLTMLRDRIAKVMGNLDTTDYLNHAADVSAALSRACSTLNDIAGQYGTIPFEGLRLAALSARYSIESERFVLGWLIENHEDASYQQLIADYKDMQKSMSVELF